MPHKHTRRKGDDKSNYDLAPSTIAKPLAPYKNDSKVIRKQNSALKRKPVVENGYTHDDTPRAFARMMQLQASKKRPRSGLDDGNASRTSKDKKRRTQDTTKEPAGDVPSEKMEVPKILPGERLADYGARVNHALPVGGLARKGKVKVEGIKERQTKTEKRLQKLYASWREEETRLNEKDEERREQEEEAEEEREAAMGGQSLRVLSNSTKAKRKKMIGEQPGGDDDDPWAELKMKRERPRGLHDVVQAPPNLKTVPKNKFKVQNGAKADVANVPTAAGSLKRREELSSARREVIERYRSMMKNG